MGVREDHSAGATYPVNTLCAIGVDGSQVHVMDPNGGTSHFVWRDPQHVFAFAWHPSHGERFYLFKDLSDAKYEDQFKDPMTKK